MENINIFDNFLTESELVIFLEKINNTDFDYGYTSNSREKFDNLNFGIKIVDDFFNKFIKTKIESIIFKKFYLDRNYFNSITYGDYGSYHIDSYIKNTYTFCIYITDIPNSEIENADGDILLKIPNTNFIVCINTLMNRAVFFPSTYFHKGMSYNRFYNNKRFCFTWKLTEIIE